MIIQDLEVFLGMRQEVRVAVEASMPPTLAKIHMGITDLVPKRTNVPVVENNLLFSFLDPSVINIFIEIVKVLSHINISRIHIL